jgi:hypothetical protein
MDRRLPVRRGCRSYVPVRVGPLIGGMPLRKSAPRRFCSVESSPAPHRTAPRCGTRYRRRRRLGQRHISGAIPGNIGARVWRRADRQPTGARPAGLDPAGPGCSHQRCAMPSGAHGHARQAACYRPRPLIEASNNGLLFGGRRAVVSAAEGGPWQSTLTQRGSYSRRSTRIGVTMPLI